MKTLIDVLNLCFTIHEGVNRKWDNKTPYAVHPMWCAMMFLQETSFPPGVDREQCALALLLHDGPEDTGLPLPDWVPLKVIELVKQMTFTSQPGSTAIERKEIWVRDPLVRLLKLYDKTSNLLDGSWMPAAKRNEEYVPYILELAKDVENNFGNLNIVKIARAIAIPV